ncbi:hypothetical protein B0H19DRAFT_1171944 [Mycena capillaripes]|nr:hypothetical protein B0H19DRAFT_1171944 [Mycena capillaripes]
MPLRAWSQLVLRRHAISSYFSKMAFQALEKKITIGMRDSQLTEQPPCHETPNPQAPPSSDSEPQTPHDLRTVFPDTSYDPDLHHSERPANKVTDAANGAVEAANSFPFCEGRDAVATAGAQVAVKDILEEALEGVPALMDALETLSKAHPFPEIAFLLFKLIYHQECQRRDNDKKRVALFLKIKDVMVELAELRQALPQNNEALENRLKPLCRKMEVDIRECFNALSAQERCSISIKFLKASRWNKVLALYAARFVETREKVSYALRLDTYVAATQTNQIVAERLELLSSFTSVKEQKMSRWFELYEGEKAVLDSDEKCAELIKFEASPTVSRPTSVVGWLARERTRKGAVLDNDDDEKAISSLRSGLSLISGKTTVRTSTMPYRKILSAI